MEITLEKIELVKDRTGVTYAEAKQALEETDGSVVDAIIAIEETVNAGRKERSFGDKGQALFGGLKEIVKKGNVARIQVKKDEETVVNIPLNAGILGICIAPLASVVAIVAAFGFKCSIEVVKTDGTIIDVSDTVTETVSTAIEKGSDAADKMKEKGADLFEKGKAKGSEYTDKIKDSDLYEKAKDKAEDLADDLKEKAEDLKSRGRDKAGDAEEAAEEVAEAAEDAAEEAEEIAEDAADEIKDEE